MVTIKDIANITGVSPTTVANVIHGRTNKVSKENVKRIQDALKEYHYVPKLAQETMTRGRTRLIGVVIHTTKVYKDNVIADPFYGTIVGVVEQELRKAGYYMLLYTEMDLDAIFQMSASWSVAGIITVTFAQKDYEKLVNLTGNCPVVGIDTYGRQGNNIYNIGLDDVNGSFQITDYLFESGYDEVLLLMEENARGADMVRVEGYKQALVKHGRSYQSKYHIYVDPEHPEKQRKRLKELQRFAGRNYAIFCVSDQLAARTMRSFLEDGYKIPEDIGIAGFDNNIYAQMVYPRLTTVHQDIPRKAEEAVKMLIKLIEGRPVEKKEEILSTQLIVRDSTRR
ncbi:MAG: LacI family DNA-binding transcriptional regulator [Blautia sp.]|nr:LacI family DNA-binding transcriptional regulator [Blautia sp.]